MKSEKWYLACNEKDLRIAIDTCFRIPSFGPAMAIRMFKDVGKKIKYENESIKELENCLESVLVGKIERDFLANL